MKLISRRREAHVTLRTEQGATLKARLGAGVVVRRGDRPGLSFRPQTLSVFDQASGRALRSALHEGTLAEVPFREEPVHG